MVETTKTQKINSIHVLRGVAIMMIVFIHCLGVFKNGNLIGNSYLFSFLNLLAFNFTTVFVLIGGFLFQHLSYKFSAKKYYLSKIKTVICPYIIISIFCFFLFYFDEFSKLPWYSFTEPNIIKNIFMMIITGTQLLPLWFIPMIAIIYLLSPLLHYWSKKNLIIASIICMFWIVMFPKPDFKQPILNLFHFGPVYLIGMMIRQNYEIVMKAVKDNVLLVISFFFLCFFVTFIYRYTNNVGVEKLYLDTLQKIILFLLALHFLEKLNRQKNEGWSYKFCSYMANLSFPIYFMHEIFIIGIEKLVTNSPLKFMIETDNGDLASLGAISFLILALAASILVANVVIFIFKDKAKYLIGANR